MAKTNRCSWNLNFIHISFYDTIEEISDISFPVLISEMLSAREVYLIMISTTVLVDESDS